jgi:hypothetical protein
MKNRENVCDKEEELEGLQIRAARNTTYKIPESQNRHKKTVVVGRTKVTGLNKKKIQQSGFTAGVPHS